VPLIDVVRASVAEVEEYPRVEVRRLPKVAITGGAVADLTHLVAELVDNATVFSPPNTKVHVHGERVGTGYVLEVEDRGLGMGKAAMTETNQRLESVQELDLFDSDRLGLFVVARLANRHGVKVSLRPSAYGGTTAVVLIPTRLLEALPDPSQAPRTPRRNAPAEAVNGDSPASRAFGPATGGMAGLTGVSTRRLPGTGQPEGEADGAAASAAEAEAGAAAEAEAGFGAVAGPDGSASLPGQRRNLRAALGGALPELPPEAPPDGALVIPTAFAGSGPALQPPPSARPVAPPDPEPASESATVPNPTSTTDPGPELNPDSDPDPLCDLPRRVRQASLVPQLRGEPAEDPEAQAAREGTLPPARSPEQARATMSAFRSGWVRGRQQHDTPHREEHTPVTQPARRNEEAAPDDRDDEPSR
jgi:hypothetical protein